MCVIHIYIHTHFSYLFAPGAYKPLGATRTELFDLPRLNCFLLKGSNVQFAPTGERTAKTAFSGPLHRKQGIYGICFNHK